MFYFFKAIATETESINFHTNYREMPNTVHIIDIIQ